MDLDIGDTVTVIKSIKGFPGVPHFIRYPDDYMVGACGKVFNFASGKIVRISFHNFIAEIPLSYVEKIDLTRFD